MKTHFELVGEVVCSRIEMGSDTVLPGQHRGSAVGSWACLKRGEKMKINKIQDFLASLFPLLECD